MRATGKVMKIDKLGRLVISTTVRKQLGINVGDSIDIDVDGQSLVLGKHVPMCTICLQKSQDRVVFKGKTICRQCVSELLNI